MPRLATSSLTAFVSRLEKAGYFRREIHMNQVLTSSMRAESKEWPSEHEARKTP